MIDQGLAIFFKGPSSYTGEDVLELHGHGGPLVLDLLLARVMDLGARMARPGVSAGRPCSWPAHCRPPKNFRLDISIRDLFYKPPPTPSALTLCDA